MLRKSSGIISFALLASLSLSHVVPEVNRPALPINMVLSPFFGQQFAGTADPFEAMNAWNNNISNQVFPNGVMDMPGFSSMMPGPPAPPGPRGDSIPSFPSLPPIASSSIPIPLLGSKQSTSPSPTTKKPSDQILSSSPTPKSPKKDDSDSRSRVQPSPSKSPSPSLMPKAISIPKAQLKPKPAESSFPASPKPLPPKPSAPSKPRPSEASPAKTTSSSPSRAPKQANPSSIVTPISTEPGKKKLVLTIKEPVSGDNLTNAIALSELK